VKRRKLLSAGREKKRQQLKASKCLFEDQIFTTGLVMASLIGSGVSFEDTFLLSQLKLTLPNVVKEHEDYWNNKLMGKTK
jgi:hypothetical protein